MNLPAWGVNIVKSLKAIARRRMEDEHSTLNNEHDYDDETNYEHDPNKMMSIKRHRLNPLISGSNFIKSCLTDMSKCANASLVLASDASVGLPQWGINIVKSLKAIAAAWTTSSTKANPDTGSNSEKQQISSIRGISPETDQMTTPEVDLPLVLNNEKDEEGKLENAFSGASGICTVRNNTP